MLNFKIIYFFFKNCYRLELKKVKYKKAFIENLPIPPISSSNQHIANELIDLGQKVTSIKKKDKNADISEYDKRIDYLVAQLYELTDGERERIEKWLQS